MGKRIVVKVGTSTLIRDNGATDLRTLDHLARVLSDVRGMGNDVILVSSGAIGVGTRKLGLPERPSELKYKQAVAAVGQCELMYLYDKFFGDYNQTVAQILLSGGDVESPLRKENLERTFEALLELGVIPVVNENDSVSSAEIETGRNKILGDNDTLSAIVAVLCNADILIILTDIDGLYNANPFWEKNAELIPVVHEINDDIRAFAGVSGSSNWGTGGMVTKLAAAELALRNGIETVITSGSKTEGIYDILEGKSCGTRFSAKGANSI